MAEQVFYKKLLIDVSAMKGIGIENLHQRVMKLIAVFEDAEFRADIGGDDFDLAVILERYIDDCALSFLELRAVMQEFPNVDEWKVRSLKELYRLALDRSTPVRSVTTTAVIEPTERPTRKQFEIVENKARENEVRANQFKSELDELREENESLKKENEALRQRVSELESIIEGSGAEENAAIARL